MAIFYKSPFGGLIAFLPVESPGGLLDSFLFSWEFLYPGGMFYLTPVKDPLIPYVGGSCLGLSAIFLIVLLGARGRRKDSRVIS